MTYSLSVSIILLSYMHRQISLHLLVLCFYLSDGPSLRLVFARVSPFPSAASLAASKSNLSPFNLVSNFSSDTFFPASLSVHFPVLLKSGWTLASRQFDRRCPILPHPSHCLSMRGAGLVLDEVFFLFLDLSVRLSLDSFDDFSGRL